MLVKKQILDYLAETASSSPTPGGGSASALAGALGVSLAEMVINLTVGKKKYAEVSAELAGLLPELAKLRSHLQSSVDKDAQAFNGVMAAFGLPKETEDQKKVRSEIILEATLKATEVPLGVMETSVKALQMTLTVAQKGNVNSASDAGVAGLLLASAIDGAALNVRINLPGLSDHTFAKEAARKVEEILARKTALESAVREAVAKHIK